MKPNLQILLGFFALVLEQSVGKVAMRIPDAFVTRNKKSDSPDDKS